LYDSEVIREKRAEIIRHVEHHGCEFRRDGGNHAIYVNRKERDLLLFRGTAK
jgi:predicted RNA binding protein YcfA (HicA-like mRNA interferase family)